MRRSILAVAAGFAASGAMAILIDLMIPFLYATGPGGGAAVRRLAVLGLTMVTVYAAVGAWICLRLARWQRPRKHLVALLVTGDVLFTASLIGFWGTQPLWYGLGLLVVYPAGVLIGGRATIAHRAHHETDVPAGCRE